MRKHQNQKESFIDRIGGRGNAIAMAIFAVVVLTIGIIWIEIDARRAEEAQYIDSWPITVNQYVEIGYAGKGGF